MNDNYSFPEQKVFLIMFKYQLSKKGI